MPFLGIGGKKGKDLIDLYLVAARFREYSNDDYSFMAMLS